MSATRLRLPAVRLPRLPSWRLTVPLLLYVVGLGALLYSVYGQRSSGPLIEGRPSPTLYKSPVDSRVVDPIATERARQDARDQVSPVYSRDDHLSRLIIDAVTVAPLPGVVQEFIGETYRRQEGVRSEQLEATLEQAVAIAPENRRREVRLTLQDRLAVTARPNALLTEAAQEAAANAVAPLTRPLQAGQTIVQEGEIITDEDLRVLEAVGLYSPQAEAAVREFWLVIACLLMALLLSLPLWYAHHKLKDELTREQLYFLAIISLCSLAAQRLALLADPGFIIISLVTLLMAALVSDLVAVGWGAYLAVVVALLTPASPLGELLVVLTAATVSSLMATRFKTRSSLLLAGSLGGVVAALPLGTYGLLTGTLGTASALTSALWLLGGGILAGTLAIGLITLAESFVGFLTEFRLLELTNPSHPLLQKLLLEAPGSYQHSLIISNLVEQAVGNIGGNPLMARVGALYHDVGKSKRPQFFVENQFAGENPHDHISPHLSYLIITSHVRDGVELMREYGVPRALEPFVVTHHGTTVLSYFYKRALEDSAKIDELNFRYAGPRPRTRETAVLMLADAVESASRTLSEPSQGSIRAMIDRIFEQRLQDQQLAESPLNFHDLEVVANTFERMLTAILHRRVRYPSAEEIQSLKRVGERGERAGDSRRNPALPLP